MDLGEGMGSSIGDNKQGLPRTKVNELRGQYGYNEVSEAPPSRLRAILERLWGLIPWMFEAALVLEIAGKRFWSLLPSGYVASAAIGNVILASVLAAGGFLTAPVPLAFLACTFAAVLAMALVLDQIKIVAFHGGAANELSLS
jgi:hypothetical protein